MRKGHYENMIKFIIISVLLTLLFQSNISAEVLYEIGIPGGRAYRIVPAEIKCIE